MPKQKPHFRFVDGEPEIVGDSKILKYIKDNMWERSSGEGRKFVEWIMKEGEYFGSGSEIPEEVNKVVEQQGSMADTQRKQCYSNSQGLAFETQGEYTYYEGWAITEAVGFPLQHAFNIKNKEVIDLTYSGRFKVEEYYGVPIPWEYISKQIIENERCVELTRSYFQDEVAE